MPTSAYPGALDTFPAVTGSTRTDTGVPHAELHTLEDEALAGLQTKVGADASADHASHDWKLARVVTLTTGAITGSTTRTIPVSNGSGFHNGNWLFVTDGTNSLYGQISSGGGTASLVIAVIGMVVVGTANSIATDSAVVLAGAPGVAGASGSVAQFNFVSDFGADPSGATDSDTAFANAMTAMAAAGGGAMYMGYPGGAHYKFSGALQDTGRSNAQLLLPALNGASDTQIIISLFGDVPGGQIFGLTGTVPLPTDGVVLESTLSSGSGALLGGWGPSGSFGNFTCIHVVLRNLTFRMHANATNSAVDLSHVNTCDVDGCTFDTGAYSVDTVTQPTHTNSVGLITPGLNNGAYTRLGTNSVIGFYVGMVLNEHAKGDGCQSVFGCADAYVFYAGFHASHFTRLMSVWCQNVIHTEIGDHYTSIGQLDIEHAPGGHWYSPVYDIDDPNHYLNGDMRWHIVTASVGVTHTFVVNGATNFKYAEMGSSLIGPPGATGAPGATGSPGAAGATGPSNYNRIDGNGDIRIDGNGDLRISS